jgi:suppressor for copper-sensitivity B
MVLWYLLLTSVLWVQVVKAADESDYQQVSTGWLFDFQHPSVSVQMQLTGEQNTQLNTVNALLQLELQTDWKTYWRSPGDGGEAPILDISQSSNIDDVVWSWPAPTRYNVLGVDTLGYKGTVDFPLTLHIQDPSKPAILNATLIVSSCTTICVQNNFQLDLHFSSDQLVEDEDAIYTYREAIALVPIKLDPSATDQQLPVTVLNSLWNNSEQTLTVEINNNLGWTSPDIFVDSEREDIRDVSFSKPEISITEHVLTATIKATRWGDELNLNQSPINLTITDNGQAVELPTTLGESPQNADVTTLFSMFLIALLGGLILNIMPCVLPVLGMKLSGVLSAQGIDRSQVRKQFIASSLGILSSFWLLAAFLLTLKLSGQALGWGIQFQSPYFISFMVIITALFAANMLDVFTIQLPVNMQTWLATKGSHSYIGHFFQGVFATLLATPCSAPFLGTAVAFSLGASAVQLFIIFTALGLGMALPWIVIALFPSLALFLPKPGRWMNGLKIFFGLMVLVTSYWLLSLLTAFVGISLTLYFALLLTVFFLYFLSKKQQKKLFNIVALTIFLTVASAAAFSYYNMQSQQGDKLQWVTLNRAVIDSEVAQGKVVFVDVTAAWCITCKANKIGVLLQDPVHSRLQEDDVVVMKGDWTTASEEVTEYLQSYGRVAVPFNIVYGANAPEGIQLQTILTSDVVLDAITQAK